MASRETAVFGFGAAAAELDYLVANIFSVTTENFEAPGSPVAIRAKEDRLFSAIGELPDGPDVRWKNPRPETRIHAGCLRICTLRDIGRRGLTSLPVTGYSGRDYRNRAPSGRYMDLEAPAGCI